MKRIGPALDGTPYKSRYELSCGCITERYDHNVEKNIGSDEVCSSCVENKYNALLLNLGLELLEKLNKDVQSYRVVSCGHILTLRRASLNKQKTFTCKTCQDIQTEKLYTLRGVELISDSTNSRSQHKLFRFVSCGHTQSIDKVLIKRDTFRCQQCYDNELATQAFSSGFELIGPSTKEDCKNNYDYRKYKRIECGHTRDIGVASVRSGIVGCIVCDDIRFNQEAVEAGFELVGPSQDGKGHKRQYKYIKCGHTINVTPAALRRRGDECPECRELGWSSTAENLGIELLADDQSKAGYKIYKLQCGHEHSFRMSHISCGYFKCSTCFTGYKELKSFAYLILIESNTNSFLKFGFGKHPEHRKYAYGLDESFTKKVVAIKDFNTGNEAQAFERDVHSKYKEHVLCKKEQKLIMKVSGYTECYPLSLLDVLIKELNGN